ncbi:MAG: hypothetical protein H7210_01525 [Pyrinomonadaceae bacterium]|nr:hypothetical protein [Phycisphaerales bacterium]
METLIAGAVLAAMSGLAVLAYRHPRGFNTFANYLLVCLGVAFVATNAFAVFVVVLESVATENLDSASRATVHTSLSAIQPRLIPVFAALVVSAAYILFLNALPLMGLTSLHDEAKEEEEDEEEGEGDSED